jgi:hypothetical protein
MYYNAIIRVAVAQLVVINFRQHFLLAYLVLINMAEIRLNHYATHIWILLVVLVICQIHLLADLFQHYVKCTLPIEFFETNISSFFILLISSINQCFHQKCVSPVLFILELFSPSSLSFCLVLIGLAIV